MATALDVIKRAYRVSNIVPLGVDLTGDQQVEALDLLNSILLSTVGNEVGDVLRDLRVGGDFDETAFCDPYVPANVRLVCNLETPTSLDLPPRPQDGQRVAVVDALGNFGTYSLTLVANGNTIDYDDTSIRNTDNDVVQWIYRADESNWATVTPLDVNDFLPFPDDFSEYFVLMLASRLSSSYGQALTGEQVSLLKRARQQIIARYTQSTEKLPDLDVRGYLSDVYFSFSKDDFNKGRPGFWK
jgi:hypothetical protein